MVSHDDSKPFVHRPVMADEVVALVADVPPGELLDATVGGGGHSAAICSSRPDSTSSDSTVIRPPCGRRGSTGRLRDRVRLVRSRFDNSARVSPSSGRPV